MARREGDFTPDVYKAALQRGVCEECGQGHDPTDPWRVHHIIFLDWGIRNGYPIPALMSLANARLYHESCHNHIHTLYDEPPQKDIDFVLSQVAIQGKLF